MEYNNTKTINSIHSLLSLIESEAAILKGDHPSFEGVRLEANNEELGIYYRTCELMENYLGRIETLIDNMLKEREQSFM